MKKTIYNVAVLMENQETCDRMKQLCIDNGLPYWKFYEYSFKLGAYCKYFRCVDDEFFVAGPSNNQPLVTESEFIKILKQEKA